MLAGVIYNTDRTIFFYLILHHEDTSIKIVAANILVVITSGLPYEGCKPSAVVFGHVHEARGSDIIERGNGTSTRLYNAAIMNRDQLLSPLTIFEITPLHC